MADINDCYELINNLWNAFGAPVGESGNLSGQLYSCNSYAANIYAVVNSLNFDSIKEWFDGNMMLQKWLKFKECQADMTKMFTLLKSLGFIKGVEYPVGTKLWRLYADYTCFAQSLFDLQSPSDMSGGIEEVEITEPTMTGIVVEANEWTQESENPSSYGFELKYEIWFKIENIGGGGLEGDFSVGSIDYSWGEFIASLGGGVFNE